MLDSEILRYEGLKLGRGSKYGYFEMDLYEKDRKEYRSLIYH